MLRALAYRNYRLFFGGQVRVARRHLDHDHRHQLAGLPADRIGGAARHGRVREPAAVVSPRPFAGIIVDRIDRHRLLVVTQTISMLQSFALAALSFPGT
jgi:hypothetical protein